MNLKNKKNLKISIVTVCYNSENTIKLTLDSISSQTFKKFEHLIIDGKSEDNTLSIIQNYSHEKKIVSEVDDGIYAAMNKGINIATGEIIGFLNSDDFYFNNDVLSKVSLLFKEDPSLDACYADLIYVDRKNTSKKVRYWKSCDFKPGMFSKGWTPAHPTFFLRRSVFSRFGKFDLNFTISADVELMMRLLEVHNIKAKYVPEVWVNMRTGGLSNKSFKNIIFQNFEVLKALRKYKLLKSIFIFFTYKIVSRCIQFFRVHNKR